ncbi:MAG: hypothetical protein CR991_11810 [Proteobacteria bacterium]|nr:MAG: hypothetical protein CR991_11810 [Pseudomonadota bacterium]
MSYENALLTPVKTMAHRCYVDKSDEGIIVVNGEYYQCPQLVKTTHQVVYAMGNNTGRELAVFSNDEHNNGVFIGVAKIEKWVGEHVKTYPINHKLF